MVAGAGLKINTNFSGQQPPTPPQPIQQRSPEIKPLPAPEINTSLPVVETSDKLSIEPEKVYHETTIKPPPAQPSFDLANWFALNKKSVSIGLGSIAALLVLIVAIKYVVSLDFGKSRNNPQNTQPVEMTIQAKPFKSVQRTNPQQTTTEQPTYQGNTASTIQSISPGMYPQASERFLSRSEIANLNKDQLKIMRNEIFARHGYIFKTPDMKSYFAQQSWYHGQFHNVNSMLSGIEKQNIELIRKYE